MTKISFALAAAVIAGTAMTSAANAGGIRVGFGFPLGSFIAHSNQNYDGGCRNCDRPRYTPRRDYVADEPVRKIKRAPKIDVAETPAPVAPVIKTAKLEDRLPSSDDTSDTSSSTKSSVAATDATKSTSSDTTGTATKVTTDAVGVSSNTTLPPVTVETPKTQTVASVDKTSASNKDLAKTSDTDTKPVCRRYSATVGGLVDMPCDQ